MPSTQEKIIQVNKEISQLKLVDDHYHARLNDLRLLQEESDALEDRLVKLYEEIEKLESRSLSSVLQGLIGNKEKKIETAKENYFEVNLEYNECKKNIETLQFELQVLHNKTALLAEKQSEFKSLSSVREEELRTEDSIQGKRMRKLLEDIEENGHQLQHLDSIGNSGRLAMKKVSMTILALREASNWGKWNKTGKKRPKMRGYQKKRATEDAKQFANEAIRSLKNFEKDLASIGIKFQAEELDLTSFNSILDVFFDNVISDWIFQQKAQKNLATLDRIMEDLKLAVGEIENSAQMLKNESTELYEGKEKILLS